MIWEGLISSSVPSTPNQLTPEWLTVALRQAVATTAEVRHVTWERIGIDRGFTGWVGRGRLTYVDDCSDVPRSVIAKLPTAETGDASAYRRAQQRDPALLKAFYRRAAREIEVYRTTAQQIDLPSPTLYFGQADAQAQTVALLLEDLAAAEPGDALSGCSPKDAAAVLAAIAPVHARWWGREWAGLPPWGADPEASQARYGRQVDVFLDRVGDRVPDIIRETAYALRGGYAGAVRRLADRPRALIHADLHLDNVLFDRGNAGRPVSVLDWQTASSGPAAIDVAGFLVGSLISTERAAAEPDLIRGYIHALTRHGVDEYTEDDLRTDIGLAVLCQLAGVVGWFASVDPDQLTGRERALLDATIGDSRLTTAILDHDVLTLLR